MKKIYIQPLMEATFVEASEIIAESLPIIPGKPVPGGNSLTKKNDWDIFGSGEDEVED